MGAGLQTSKWTICNGVQYAEFEIGKGNLWLFPNWQAGQNEKCLFLENFSLYWFKTSLTILLAGWPSLWCQRSRLDMELWLQWTKLEFELEYKLAV